MVQCMYDIIFGSMGKVNTWLKSTVLYKIELFSFRVDMGNILHYLEVDIILVSNLSSKSKKSFL